MKNDFELVIGSPIDYEQIVVYIKMNNIPIALINKEDGNDNIKIEMFEESVDIAIHLDDFISTLTDAKIILQKWKMLE
jgi:hypothetical protein